MFNSITCTQNEEGSQDCSEGEPLDCSDLELGPPSLRHYLCPSASGDGGDRRLGLAQAAVVANVSNDGSAPPSLMPIMEPIMEVSSRRVDDDDEEDDGDDDDDFDDDDDDEEDDEDDQVRKLFSET